MLNCVATHGVQAGACCGMFPCAASSLAGRHWSAAAPSSLQGATSAGPAACHVTPDRPPSATPRPLAAEPGQLVAHRKHRPDDAPRLHRACGAAPGRCRAVRLPAGLCPRVHPLVLQSEGCGSSWGAPISRISAWAVEMPAPARLQDAVALPWHSSTTAPPHCSTMLRAAELAERVGAHHRVMAHWEKALPGRVLDVHYSDVVRDVVRGRAVGFNSSCLCWWQRASCLVTVMLALDCRTRTQTVPAPASLLLRRKAPHAASWRIAACPGTPTCFAFTSSRASCTRPPCCRWEGQQGGQVDGRGARVAGVAWHASAAAGGKMRRLGCCCPDYQRAPVRPRFASQSIQARWASGRRTGRGWRRCCWRCAAAACGVAVFLLLAALLLLLGCGPRHEVGAPGAAQAAWTARLSEAPLQSHTCWCLLRLPCCS